MEEKAARAYDQAALKYWGPSTHINFPVITIIITFFLFSLPSLHSIYLFNLFMRSNSVTVTE